MLTFRKAIALCSAIPCPIAMKVASLQIRAGFLILMNARNYDLEEQWCPNNKAD
ncbi:MAG: hypothetical protein KME30_29725 [Iphinoe sp. HA4291-MV1]|nr:hypothetical protein [Iphinoe sp. HA4291-MV1]